jgi:hypothetical protein
MPFSGGSEPIAGGFIRLRDRGAPLDVEALIALLDAWWPALFSVTESPRPIATVAFTAEILSDPALIDPDRIEIISTGYRTRTLRDVFGYQPDWPLVSPARRAEATGLVGAATSTPAPGPEAGEHAGFPGAGDPTRRHMDARSLGESASEAG